MRAFSLWPRRQPMRTMEPKQNVLENFRPLAKKTHTGGRRYKAARSVISSWDHTSFIDQSQGPQFNFSIGWETRNNISLKVQGILKNAHGLREEDNSIPCLLYKSKVWRLASNGNRKEFAWMRGNVSRSMIPTFKMLTYYLWGSHAILMLGYMIHKHFVIKCQMGQGHSSPMDEFLIQFCGKNSV